MRLLARVATAQYSTGLLRNLRIRTEIGDAFTETLKEMDAGGAPMTDLADATPFAILA
jgi:hypothetical protein